MLANEESPPPLRNAPARGRAGGDARYEKDLSLVANMKKRFFAQPVAGSSARPRFRTSGPTPIMAV